MRSLRLSNANCCSSCSTARLFTGRLPTAPVCPSRYISGRNRLQSVVIGRPRRASGTPGASGMSAAKETEAAEPEGRELTFTNSRGEKLVGILVDTGSTDVVLLCHGYVANHGMCQFPLLAAELSAAGVSSFRFDHPCAIFSKSERRGPFLMGNHEEEVQDMRDAVDFLQGTLGKRVVCLLGHSKGGTNALMFASRHHDVPKIVNLAGRFKCRDGTLQRFGADILDRLAAEKAIPRKESWGEWVMTEQDFLNRVNLDTEGMARGVPPSVRMLCLHGTADRTIPWQESEACAALVPSSQLVLVEGADHNFTSPEAGREMARRVKDFVLS